MSTIRISDIIIGERARKDMGDIAGMSKSFERTGLLHPVVLNKSNLLIAGHRRIEAAKLLGWKEIPVTIIEVEDLLAAERDENEVRKNLTPSEAVTIGRLIEKQHKAKVLATSRERARSAVSHRNNVAKKDVDVYRPLGKTIDVVSSAVGMSPSSYSRAEQIVAAAENDPKKFGDLPAKMDETGNVSGTYREMTRRKAGDFNGNGKRRGSRKDKEAVYVADTKRKREIAGGQKSRMVRSLSTVTGHCRGLEDLDVPMILAVCTNEEIKEWTDKAREAGRVFHKFAVKLGKGMKHGN